MIMSIYLLISVGEVFVKEIHGLEVLKEESLKLLELLGIGPVSSNTCEFLPDCENPLELRFQVLP